MDDLRAEAARRIFKKKAIIGMVHLLPLPGSPKFGGDIDEIYHRALVDARALAEAGVDGLIVENFGDHPYRNEHLEPMQFATMAAIVREVVRDLTDRFEEDSPLIGVNVQFNAYAEELAIAKACGARFIRAEVFVEHSATEDGPVRPCAAQVARLNRQWAGPQILVLADVHSKGTVPLVPMDISTAAKLAVKAGAGAVVVTGEETGGATPIEDLRRVRSSVPVPVLAGSGITEENLGATLEACDGVIVGSSLKEDGRVEHPVSMGRARVLVELARSRPTHSA